MTYKSMREFRVTWSQCPHIHHTKQVNFVEAASKEDAETLMRDHIERVRHIEWFSIFDVNEVVATLPAGKVKG